MQNSKPKHSPSIISKILVFFGIVLLLGLVVRVFFYEQVRQRFSDLASPIIQKDKNGDGQYDEWLSTNLFGEIIEFKRDKNHDGKVDYLETYQNGNLHTIKIDFDYNGTFETVGTYSLENEILVKMERDTNGDGKGDRMTVFDDKSGSPLRIEVDENHDGVYDTVLNDPTSAKPDKSESQKSQSDSANLKEEEKTDEEN